jgi:hypothetical protein
MLRRARGGDVLRVNDVAGALEPRGARYVDGGQDIQNRPGLMRLTVAVHAWVT